MKRSPPKVTRSLQRLLDLFSQIEDEDIREIIADVVLIESKHRSSSKKNFPWKDVRTVIDRVALFQEERGGMGVEK